MRAANSKTVVSDSLLRDNTHSGVYVDGWFGDVSLAVTRTRFAGNQYGCSHARAQKW